MHQKWALITGASSGIGWATAEAFAQANFHVLALGRRESRLQELKAQLKKINPNIEVRTYVLDITSRTSVENFFASEKNIISQIEVLVNNAGLAKGVEKIQEAQIEDWDQMIDTNVKGLLYITRGVLPGMIEKKSGHIINIGSVAGRWTYPGGGVYSATKFAVRALTDSLRLDLMGTPLRITNIEPGMVNTEFSLTRLGDQQKADKVYEGMTPLNSKDIAETIMWCVNRPPHVNIQELIIYPTDQAGVGYVNRRTHGN